MEARLPIAQIVGSHGILYETLFNMADSKKTGTVMAVDAVGFLKQSGLSQDILAAIWDKADKCARGYLDNYDFCVALKLIALSQNGQDPTVENLGIEVPPPNLGEASKTAESASVGVSGTWEVSPSEQAKYTQVFESLGPVNGILSGALCRQVFMKSRLPVDVLGKIWELSDIDRDGALDREEFVLAMHLVYKVSMEKQPLPAVLGASLIPPSKVSHALAGASAPASSSQHDLASLQTPVLNPTTPAVPTAAPTSIAVPWVVTPAEKTQYDGLFQAADVNKTGYLTGADARDIFMKSGLPPAILAHIWQLCDSTGNGKLNPEQFALAMYLTNARLRGVDLPVQLTPEMVPPSLRQPTAAVAVPAALAPSSEFPESKELQELSAEVEAIRKERQSVEAEIEQDQANVNKRNAELAQLQREVEQLTGLLQQLEQQRVEAQKKLDDLDEQRNRCQRAIDDVKERKQQEEVECTQIQQNIADFLTKSEEKQDDLVALRQSVEAIRTQERQLEATVTQKRQASESEKAETADIERQCDELQARLKCLEQLGTLLKDATTSYDTLLNGDAAAEPNFDPDVPISQLISSLVTSPQQSSVPFADSSSASKMPPQRPPAPTGSSVNIQPSPQTGGDDFITDLFWGNAAQADPHLRSVSAPPTEQLAGAGAKQSAPPARPPPPKKAMTPLPSSAAGQSYAASGPLQPLKSSNADPFASSASAFPAATNDPFASSGHPDPFKSSGADPFADDTGFANAFSSSSGGGGGFDDDDAWAVRK